MTYPLYEADIAKMNERYQLPTVVINDWSAVTKRLEQFKDILDKEFVELTDIQRAADEADDTNWGSIGEKRELPLKIAVMLSDLLGDIMVYCSSEAQRWGLPMQVILLIIMASNTSKMGADGKPIINPENGKFEKGPFYWKPEPLIEYVLTHADNLDSVQFSRSAEGVITYRIQEPRMDFASNDPEEPTNSTQPNGEANGAEQA